MNSNSVTVPVTVTKHSWSYIESEWCANNGSATTTKQNVIAKIANILFFIGAPPRRNAEHDDSVLCNCLRLFTLLLYIIFVKTLFGLRYGKHFAVRPHE